MEIFFEQVTDENLTAYGNHKASIVIKSGVDGNPIYNPYSQEELSHWKWPANSYLEGREKNLNETGWKRSWAIINKGMIIGSLDLLRSNVPSALHRCLLMMGVSELVKKRVLEKK